MEIIELQQLVTDIIKNNMKMMEIPMQEIAKDVIECCKQNEMTNEEIDTTMNFAGWTVSHYIAFFWSFEKLRHITKLSPDGNASDNRLDID